MKFGKKNRVSLNPLDYNICLLGESKIGKEQPISEPVLTEFGWIPMGEIGVGDRVFGEDGKLHNVIGVFPQGVKDVYKVTFRDGTSTRCGYEHLWHVSTTKQRANMRIHNDDRYKILPLSEIIKDYKRSVLDETSPNGIRYKHKYSVPINKPVEFDMTTTETLPIHPYALGLLLGDGGFTQNTITFTNSESELFKELEDCLQNFRVQLHMRTFENHWQATLCTGERNSPLKMELNNFGLLGCSSRTKFIPKEYMFAPITQRLQLLSGLINTDGCVTQDGKTIKFSTRSTQLANDVANLARSLGYIASVKSYERFDKCIDEFDEVGADYVVAIIGNDYSDLHLSTKHVNKISKKKIDYVKTITNIELVGREESQCIMLDNPSHLYITNDYIVTHNTTLVYEVCEKLVGDEGYLFAEMKGERGADAIEGINFVNCPNWNSDYDELTNSVGFANLCNDIIENKTTDYPGLKVLVVDTYDYLIEVAEEESIRLYNKMCREKGDIDKVTQSINAAWGGYGKGEKKAMALMFDLYDRLAEVGVRVFTIGHTKNKDMTDVLTGNSYTILTSDQQTNYFNQLKKKLHFLGLACLDRSITKDKKITAESRKIKFRDDNYSVDSGSRFANIVDEIPLDANEFINALINAIELESKKSGKSLTETKKEQDIVAKKKQERAVKAEAKAKADHQLSDVVSQIVDYFQVNKGDVDKVKPILVAIREKGYDKPQSITNVDDAREILTLCI